MQLKQKIRSQHSAISTQPSESRVWRFLPTAYRLLPTIFCLLFTAYCSLLAVSAQDTGGVKGKIRNMRGDSIAGATITARQNAKDIRSATSNNKGEFTLGGLESGVYNIVFDAKGYATGIKYSVEVKSGKVKDLGGNLIMMVDQGTKIIIRGSVFFKDGTSVSGAKVEVEKISGDNRRNIGSGYTNYSGEFTFSQPEGQAKYRITATYKGSTASKEIQVDSAAIYAMAISLDINRDN